MPTTRHDISTTDHDATLTIHSNGHVRPVLTYLELTTDQRADVDYVLPADVDIAAVLDSVNRGDWDAVPAVLNEYRFVVYLGSVYDLSDGYELIKRGTTPAAGSIRGVLSGKGWDAICTDSYFSATIVRWWLDGQYLGNDGASVVIGRCHW